MMDKRISRREKLRRSFTGFLAALVVAPIVFTSSDEVEAATGDVGSVDFSVGESTSSYRTTNVTIPDKAVLTGASVNTGSVSYTRTSPTNVQVTVNGGNSVRSEYDPYLYSQYISTTQYSSSDYFSDSMSYNSGGYSGTYYKNGSSYVSSGQLVLTDSFTATDYRETSPGGGTGSLPSSIYYNSGGYSGTLNGGSTSVVSGTPSGTWSVTRTVQQNHPNTSFASTIWAESGGYTGYIPRSGSYSTSGYSAHSAFTGISLSCLASNSGCYSYLSGQETVREFARSDYAGSGYAALTGYYVGTVRKSGNPYAVNEDGVPKLRQLWEGTVYRSESRVYTQTYSGNLTRPDTQVHRRTYSGTVTRPGYDNRTYAQSYTGYAYQPGTRYYYAYTGNLSYVMDNSAPVIGNVALLPDAWTNGNVTIRLSGLSDVGDAGYKRTRLPNGTFSSGTTVDYVATSNGVYRFEVEDDVGNILIRDVTVGNIERVIPTGVISQSPTTWVNDKVTINVNSILDTGGSDYRRTLLPDGTYSSDRDIAYDVTTNGTYNFDIFDNAGNMARRTLTVSNVDKLAPTGVVTQTPTSWTRGNVTLNLGSVADTGGSGVKEIRLPDGSIVAGTSASYVVSSSGTYAFEIFDNAGNSRVVSHVVSNIDVSLPDGEIVPSTTSWTNGNIVLTIRDMIDVGGSGFRRVQLPSGVYSSTNPSAHTVTTNGTYTFRIEDNAGNIRDKLYTVSNIDKVLPTFDVVSDNTSWTNQDVVLRARNFADDASGVNSVTLPNGTIVPVGVDDVTQAVSANGTYTFRFRDVAGNEATRSIVVSNIDRLNPNVPSLALSTYAWSAPGVRMIATPSTDNGPSGVSHLEYRIDGDAWKVMPTNTMEIPIGYAGELLVEVRSVDRAGNASLPVSRTARIDGTPPDINEVDVSIGERDVSISVDATDALSAIGGYRFWMKEIGTDADFRLMQDWSLVPTFTRMNLVPNRLYEFRVQVRDLNLNTVTRDAIYMVTSPDVISVETRENDYGNTVYGSWFTSLREADGIELEVSRSGNLAQKVRSGLQFVDRNLNYEQEYRYSLKNVARVAGEIVESVAIERTVMTGFPMLEMYLDRDPYHKTIFSDQVNVTGSLAYRQGGQTTIEISGVSKTLELDPLIRNKFSVLIEEPGTGVVTLPIKASLLGKEGLFDIDRTIRVELKPVRIELPSGGVIDAVYP